MKIEILMPVIKSRVRVLIGELDDVKKHIPKDCHSLNDSGYLARCTYQRANGKYPFFCIIHSKSKAVSVIAHEAVHAASFILEGMGVIADHDNDELLAYIVQHICEEAEIKLGTYK